MPPPSFVASAGGGAVCRDVGVDSLQNPTIVNPRRSTVSQQTLAADGRESLELVLQSPGRLDYDRLTDLPT